MIYYKLHTNISFRETINRLYDIVDVNLYFYCGTEGGREHSSLQSSSVFVISSVILVWMI